MAGFLITTILHQFTAFEFLIMEQLDVLLLSKDLIYPFRGNFDIILYFIILQEVMEFNYQVYLQSDITCDLEVSDVIMSFEREMMTSCIKPTIYVV